MSSYYYLLSKSSLFIKNNNDYIQINIDDILTIEMDSLYPKVVQINSESIPKIDATFFRQDNMASKGLGWSISSLIRMNDLVDVTKGIERDKKINELLK